MDPRENLELAKIIDKAGKILLVVNNQPTIDTIASMLAIYEAFVSLGKKVEAYCPDEISTAKGLPNFEKIRKLLLPNNLIISFDYIKNNIEKINYKVEGNQFNLVLTSKSDPIRLEEIGYSYTGNFDFVILLGKSKIDFLDNKNPQEQISYSNLPILTINNDSETEKDSSFNIIDKNSSTVSELVIKFLREINVEPNTRSAYCLLIGLKSGSSNFSRASAATFEAASWCMKLIEIKKEKVLTGDFGIGAPVEQKTDVVSEIKPNLNEGLEESEQLEENLAEKKNLSPDKSWFLPKIFKSSGGKGPHS